MRRRSSDSAAGSRDWTVKYGTRIELHDGFARVPDHERETLGRDVGQAIRLQGHRYDRPENVKTATSLPPGRTYLPDWTVRNTLHWLAFDAASPAASICRGGTPSSPACPPVPLT